MWRLEKEWHCMLTRMKKKNPEIRLVTHIRKIGDLAVTGTVQPYLVRLRKIILTSIGLQLCFSRDPVWSNIRVAAYGRKWWTFPRHTVALPVPVELVHRSFLLPYLYWGLGQNTNCAGRLEWGPHHGRPALHYPWADWHQNLKFMVLELHFTISIAGVKKIRPFPVTHTSFNCLLHVQSQWTRFFAFTGYSQTRYSETATGRFGIWHLLLFRWIVLQQSCGTTKEKRIG